LNSKTQRRAVAGPAGDLICAIDEPETPARGLAVICHPHPQHGGTMDNKIVVTLARAFLQCGWRAARFNFRGIGGSAGAWDEGRGEIDDALAVARALRNDGEPLAMAGFSFGAYVASHAAATLEAQPLVLVGPATQKFTVAAVAQGTLSSTVRPTRSCRCRPRSIGRVRNRSRWSSYPAAGIFSTASCRCSRTSWCGTCKHLHNNTLNR
jgi:uncharacterized protein